MAQAKGPYATKFLNEQRHRLLQLKQDMLNKINADSLDAEISTPPDQLVEDGDLAQAYLDQNVTIGLKERDIKRLRELDHALAKIDKGTYGLCEETEEPIGEDRLRRMPWARYCIEAAEQMEREAGRLKKVN